LTCLVLLMVTESGGRQQVDSGEAQALQRFLSFKQEQKQQLLAAAPPLEHQPQHKPKTIPHGRDGLKYPQCTNRTNCGNYSCNFFQYSNDYITLLFAKSGRPAFDQFYKNLKTAVDIMRSFPGVITDDYYYPHMTIEYMCCYSLVQYLEIQSIINSYSWQPFNLTFKSVVCNNGGSGVSEWVSLIILLDAASEKRMLAFVDGLENAIKAHGIPVHRPRSQQQPFHCTLGVVDGSYPVSTALAAINKAIPAFNTIPMIADTFWSVMPPAQFRAH